MWPRSDGQDATEGDQPKWTAMGALHIGDQLPDVTVEGYVLRTLQILAGLHKAANQRLEDRSNHLGLGSAAHAAAKIGRIAALTWYAANIGVSIFKSTLTFMSYCIISYIHTYIYIYIYTTYWW